MSVDKNGNSCYHVKMEEISEALKNLGLTREESDVYLTYLELGSASVLQIARKIKIPRSTIYLIIESLMNKGLVVQTALGKKKQFAAESPEKLLHLAEEKKLLLFQSVDIFTKNLPQLKAIFNRQIGKPKIRYYEGIEGIKTIYEETLATSEILVICLTQNARKIMGEYLEKYFVRAIRRMIKSSEIVTDSKHDLEYQKNFSTSRNEIICIPQKYIANTDYMIYGDRVAFITYKNGKPVGVVIEDEELVRFEKNRFEIIWKAAKAGIL